MPDAHHLKKASASGFTVIPQSFPSRMAADSVKQFLVCLIYILYLNIPFCRHCPCSPFFSKSFVYLCEWPSCMCPAACNRQFRVATIFKSMIDLISITYKSSFKAFQKFIRCISLPGLLVIIDYCLPALPRTCFRCDIPTYSFYGRPHAHPL